MLQNKVLQRIKPEKGNVFLFIFLGIAMFGALAYTVSRGFQAQSVTNLTGQEIPLAAGEILDYAQRMQRAVDRLRRRSISENTISFETELLPEYENTNCTDNRCRIFHPDGGSITWKLPRSGFNDGTPWIMTGSTCVSEIGNDCDNSSNRDEELLIVLPNMNEKVCNEINERFGLTDPPINTGTGYSEIPFDGIFDNNRRITLSSGPYNTICYLDGDALHFYSVLIAR